jgi:phosphoenolpyruvate-protein kinase (PTS system EI component)
MRFSCREDEYLKEQRNDLNTSLPVSFETAGKVTTISIESKAVSLLLLDLSPADTLQMNMKHVAGFVTDIGEGFYTAILADLLGSLPWWDSRWRPPSWQRRFVILMVNMGT